MSYVCKVVLNLEFRLKSSLKTVNLQLNKKNASLQFYHDT